MQINYNVTGSDRKKLVTAIAEIICAEFKYLGAPSFSYEVGSYRIDRNGILKGNDNSGLVADLQGLYGFKAISEEYDTPLSEAEPVPDNIQIPYEAALGGRVSPYRDYEEPPAYGTPESIETVISDRLTIEMPKSGFTDTALVNLKRLVESRSSLIKKALGVETLDIEILDETIRFPWFTDGTDADAVKAYIHFITALCEMAKTKQRINATEKAVDNEKYAFRCFLLQLGFIGDEYKEERKVLLSRLTGNSAFKKFKSEVNLTE